jgi:hypothetical protein
MQCLTDLIIFLVVVESIFKNAQSALLYRYFRQALESITQLSSFYRHVGYTIFEHLITRGYNLFQNEYVFIRDLSDRTLHIISVSWCASMKVDMKRPVAWKNSSHAPLWRFYLHCGIEETGSPGIICIVCHQVLRHPSEHGTSSMRKHLLAKAHIAK